MRVKSNIGFPVEDFPEQKSWIGKLISPLNDFKTQVIKILNDGIVFPDNFQGKQHTFKFTYQSPTINFPIGFLWTLGSPPKGFQVISATEDGAPLNCSVSWRYTEESQVQLYSVVKFTSAPAIALLTVNSKYEITVRVTP